MSSIPKAAPRRQPSATKSIDRVQLCNNAGMVAKAADFGVATVLTTVTEKTLSGPVFDELRAAFPRAELIDRTTMNAWEDRRGCRSSFPVSRRLSA